ncbi:hypothetical protein LVO79_13720 [Roseivivax marinus]|uniref:hypothetical protein n=1 Tax=Roseivivax marinus TaxID=1379903 RepID=UPI001F03853A|nr:hypothetical protein [Roseivivax marinus]UMA64076.1 hypothetical protein LVO79_13720 [Roseivivax marinus]
MKNKKDWKALKEQNRLRYYIAITNLRGHASAYARRDAEDKALVESEVLKAWIESLSLRGTQSIGNWQLNENDPPDAFVEIDKRFRSVELKELVDGEALRRIDGARKRGISLTSSSPEVFHETQWTRDRFKKEILEIVHDADSKYEQRSSRKDIPHLDGIDFLIIHTDEDWLSVYDVEKWITEIQFQPTPHISHAHLLMSYTPGYRLSYPLFTLF